jgi:hypothetical protein
MRLFYVVLGATAGVILVRRLTRAAESWTPEGVSSRLGAALTGFIDDIRDGMAERETELRAALGIDDAPTAEPH